jgi:predicted anti-sigma-YlaC factor YlaD
VYSGQVEMKIWTSEGHLSELALEMWAVAEAETHQLQAIDGHLQACSACRSQAAEWRSLFRALASLRVPEPSASFDEQVMERVRLPVEPRAASAWLPRLARRLRPVAVGAAALWTVGVIGGAAWLQSRLDIPAALLLTRLIDGTKELLLAVAIQVGAILQLSGLAELWADVTAKVPGLGVAGALALMTAMSGLAIWTLYRVTSYQPSKVDAHA